MTRSDSQTSSADGVTWDLDDLYRGPDDPAIERDMESARARAVAFEAAYRGKIEPGPSPETLRAALTELEGLYEQLDRPGTYAGLLHASKTDDPARGALLAKTREFRTAVNAHLIFFDLEWVKVADDAAEALMASPELQPRFGHYLREKRAWRPHYLGEAEEKVLEEKDVTGRAAFVRLFDETTSSLACPFEDGNGTVSRLSLQQALAKLYDPDREVRRRGADAISKALKENARLLTYVFNTIVLDHKSDCALRRFDDPMAPRHLANEIKAEVVDALMTAAERHHATVQRYYRLKGRLLGLDTLNDYDRYAPLFSDLPACDWPTARRTVQESYERFSPEAGAIVSEFFEKRWVDAELRQGKRGGAFANGTFPSCHPYILMNFADKLRDVTTLAHELGHGLHQYLARPVGYLQCGTPLTTAETASVFGEMLTFERLLGQYPDPKTRLALLCGKIEDSCATVFRQVVLTRFEQALHRARRVEGELTSERINALWLDANRPMHGDAVTLTEGYGWWWLYIGHFIRSPFYCYAYAFGELMVLALVQKYREDGPSFVPRYLDMLARGGSETPDRLLARLGVDVNDLGFWERGLLLLDGMVTEAEDLAATLNLGAERP